MGEASREAMPDDVPDAGHVPGRRDGSRGRPRAADHGRQPTVLTAAAAALARRMTERQLQDSIIGLAERRGWLAYHTFDSRRSPPGFPDLVLVRRERMLLWELKTELGRLTNPQRAWLDRLAVVAAGVAGMDVRIVRPPQWMDGTVRRALW
jgi:hypothetical protein